MQFKKITFPTQHIEGFIPDDLEVALPATTSLPLDQQHFLLSIPWSEEYQKLVPARFQTFFEHVLPYLRVRTTDVHTAICTQFLDEFATEFTNQRVDEEVLGLALILHDSGWSQLSEAEIAASLGVTGLQLTTTAQEPKIKHAQESAKIARKVLAEYQSQLNLSSDQVELICKAVLYHDRPEEVAGQGADMPLEVQYLVDLDHLWSFTHHNFWQDTLRKGVDPKTYLENLRRDLPTYFVTKAGAAKAEQLWHDRQQEVLDHAIWKEANESD